MAKKTKKGRKWKHSYQKRFEDSDFEWLASQFRKQAKVNPDLTLKEFGIRHGVQPEWISRFIDTDENRSKKWEVEVNSTFRHTVQPKWISRFTNPGGNTVILWHGTTADRAKAIVTQGFRAARKSSRKSWFTKNPNMACRIAMGRAWQRREIPVVISCEIDLGKYVLLGKPNQVFIFYPPIGKEVVRSISVVDEKRFRRHSKEAKAVPKFIGIAVTKTSGKQDVLCWMNRYLELEGEATISEEHPAVEAIFKWIKTDYLTGREKPVSNEEMVSLMTVIGGISSMELSKVSDQSPNEEEEEKFVDVVITKTSGKLGVLWWINSYKELVEEDPVSEDHPLVDVVFKWVEEQYANGRDDPISDEGMLMQVAEHLEQKERFG